MQQRKVSRPMKLYVWDDVLKDRTAGLMFAVARDVASARRCIRREAGIAIPSLESDLAHKPTVYDLASPVARIMWGGS